MMELKELTMISSFTCLKNYLKNVNNFLQHQRFWNLKEMNMAELKSFHFFIMLLEK